MGDDGKAYVGRDWGSQGGHTWGYNDIAYGICAIGDFTSDLASDKLVQTLRKLIACAEEQVSVAVVYDSTTDECYLFTHDIHNWKYMLCDSIF